MNRRHTLLAFLLVTLLAAICSAQDQANGGIKGKVRQENGATAPDVTVQVRQGERVVTEARTNRKGEFTITGLAAGTYGLTFRKPGLSVGTMEDVEVRAGRIKELPDRLILRTDEGSLAFLRGSVFDAAGRSLAGVRVELARIGPDGTTKKIDGRVTNETGSFVFRLQPAEAKYRVTASAGGTQPATKEITINGPAVYRIALSLERASR